jgi:hypothetical protein
MPTVADKITRQNNAPTPTADRKDVVGAPQIVATLANLTDGTIPDYVRENGMEALTLDTGIKYRLGVDLTTWTQPDFRPSRTWYVDPSNAGIQTGAESHPYATIASAISAADAEGSTEITLILAGGSYGNVSIPRGATLKTWYLRSRSDVSVYDTFDQPTIGNVTLQHNIGGEVSLASFTGINITGSVMGTDAVSYNFSLNFVRCLCGGSVSGNNISCTYIESVVLGNIYGQSSATVSSDDFSNQSLRNRTILPNGHTFGCTSGALQSFYFGQLATGFIDRTSSVISFTDGSRTFSIEPATMPSGNYLVYSAGLPKIKTATESIVWDAAEGLHFFYFSGGVGAFLNVTQDVEVFKAVMQGAGELIAALYWDATNNVSIRRIEERHGAEMPCSVHAYLHKYLGTVYESGGALGNFTIIGGNATLSSHAQFSIDNVIISDEDIRVSIVDGVLQDLSPVATIPIFYLSGSGVWRKKTADSFPVIYSGTAGYTGANGRLPYNRFNAGTWSLTEIADSDFVMVHYFATTDLVEPVIGIMGQAVYTTASLARAGAQSELNAILSLAELLSTEKHPLATVIFQSATAYSNTPKAKVVQADTTTGSNWMDWRSTPFFDGTVAVGIQGPPGTGIAEQTGSVTGIALNSDAGNNVIEVGPVGLSGVSKVWVMTVGVRIRVYQSSDHTIVGSLDCQADIRITTDGFGVPTVTIVNNAASFVPNLPSELSATVVDLSGSYTGTTIPLFVTRPTGVACICNARWWVEKIEDIT